MQKGKIVALDYGKKRIGVASGDFESKIAFPKTVIENKGGSYVFGEISKLLAETEAKTIVLGLPLNMDDGDSAMSEEVRVFSEKLKAETGVDVILFDERLSSFEADDLMRKAQKSSKDKKEFRDMFAAQVILQHFFDSIDK